MVPDPDAHLRYVLDAVSQIRKALAGEVPLIGFCGSPFTLACYMIEGRSGSDFHETKRMLYQRPELLHQVLDVNARAVAAHLNAQIESGAQAVMVFDTWGGALSGEAFHEFSLRYIEHVFAQLRREHDGQRVPRIVFTKGGGQWLESLAHCGADAVGLDWTTDIGKARTRVGDRVALQGNLDPAVLLSAPEVIRREAGKILAGYGYGNGHIFNLGHGVSQYTPPEHVAALVETVHSGSPQFH
jgi:uroporphyrinogen decarboxylase